jgi:hypothetical protein
MFRDDEAATDTRHPIRLAPGETVLWRGRVWLAEHVYTDAMDDYRVRWALPAPADLIVTDRRLAYVCRYRERSPRSGAGPAGSSPAGSSPAGSSATGSSSARSSWLGSCAGLVRPRTVATGQVRYEWPNRLYVLPAREGVPRDGARRLVRTSRLLLACAAYRSPGRPTLLLSDGDIADVPAADELGNLLRAEITRFRLANAAALRLLPIEVEALAAQTDAPGFANRVGGRSQCVNLLGGRFVGTASLVGGDPTPTANRGRPRLPVPATARG